MDSRSRGNDGYDDCEVSPAEPVPAKAGSGTPSADCQAASPSTPMLDSENPAGAAVHHRRFPAHGSRQLPVRTAGTRNTVPALSGESRKSAQASFQANSTHSYAPIAPSGTLGIPLILSLTPSRMLMW